MKIIFMAIVLLFLTACSLAPKNSPEPTGNTVIDNSCVLNSDCYATGCNREICSTQETAWSDCEWKQEYSCLLRTSCSCLNQTCQWDTANEQYQFCMKGVEGAKKLQKN
ncbi:hypothetical protein C4573_02285 [Candidatus Woesearchaeota archaeon]|nr:MAG: hypothetical protein C4573_02285 [Candidatus Woesearchaeota archaeon]